MLKETRLKYLMLLISIFNERLTYIDDRHVGNYTIINLSLEEELFSTIFFYSCLNKCQIKINLY